MVPCKIILGWIPDFLLDYTSYWVTDTCTYKNTHKNSSQPKRPLYIKFQFWNLFFLQQESFSSHLEASHAIKVGRGSKPMWQDSQMKK